MTDMDSSLEVASLSFEKNAAASGSGGALAAGPGTTFKLSNSTFESDSASKNGGALAMIRPSLADIKSVKVKMNIANGYGGGLYALGAAVLSLQDSTFDMASSGKGGGAVYMTDIGEASVSGCDVTVGPPVVVNSNFLSFNRRRMQATASSGQQASSSSSQCASDASSSYGSGPPGGGLHITGATAASVSRTSLTVGPQASGWRGQGLAIELDGRSVCNSTSAGTNATSGSSTGCSAVALLETKFVAADGWQPGPMDRPLYATSLAGWVAQCSNASASNCPPGLPCPPRVNASTTPQPSSQTMLEQLRSGAAGKR